MNSGAYLGILRKSCQHFAVQNEIALKETAMGKQKSLKGLDEEQIQLASSKKFWAFIENRRKQKTISRAELEKRIDATGNTDK